MLEPKSNERTFQGVLVSLINQIIKGDSKYSFSQITQEQNIGVDSSRFGDCLLYSSLDSENIVLFELKNTSWDANDEALVRDAAQKASDRGYKYYVTGTPRQLVIFQTFKQFTTLFERKLKIYTLSNIKDDNEVITPFYESLILPKLKQFLSDLSDIIHKTKPVHWDSIDKIFVAKLSSYILEASSQMLYDMYRKIHSDKYFSNELKDYLKSQDIFNVDFNFDRDSVYNICQLSNYLLYLKIIFYSYLYKEVPALNLKELDIPEDKNLLNKVLRKRFDDVLKHDYEMIFQPSVLDEFDFPVEYIPVLKRNVNEIKNLNFHDLNCDIIGAIYNTLINNQEQHQRGQHFTNTNEVDIINAFCITKDTDYILDSGCGAGTFLVRAYSFLKYFNPKLKHENIIERLWGIDIATFPAFLSVMNLTLLDIASAENYPVIIQKDFADVKSNYKYKGYFLNTSESFDVKRVDNKYSEVQIPRFDVCIGNPPYIRQEFIEDKDKWLNLAKKEHSLKKLNQQSDLYVYYLMHTSAFLKEGGRLGYVISGSWLDVSFGAGLQKFLLDNFRIIAILDNQVKRSFETASVNTVILILEKCSDEKQREENSVRFVRVFKDYDVFAGKIDDRYRVKRVSDFAASILSHESIFKSDDYHITVLNQKYLENESTVDKVYTNGNWGAKFLRSPDIYNKIISIANDKFIPLSAVVDVKYGIKTGANEFFYVKDDTETAKIMDLNQYELTFGVKKSVSKINWKIFGWYYSEMTNRHYILERKYFKPLLKSQREAVNLDVDVENLKYKVLICNESKSYLRKNKMKLLGYIKEAETLNVHKRPTCSQRISSDKSQDWFNLGDDLFIGDFIFPSKIGEKYRLIDNRNSEIYCDKVNYNIKIKDEYRKYSDIIFLLMNSFLFRLLFDLFSRQLTGNQTLSDVDVNVLEKCLILNPKLLLRHKPDLKQVLKSLKSREQGTIFEEISQTDRRQLDLIIFNELGLPRKDLNELYSAVANYVHERNEKSKSLKNGKNKKKLTFDETVSLVRSRFSEIRKYKDLLKDMETKEYFIHDLKAHYDRSSLMVSDNLFQKYEVNFKDDSEVVTVRFENIGQMQLFYFFYDKLEVRGLKLKFPKSNEDAINIFKELNGDLTKYFPQLKSFLKSSRLTSNPLKIYSEIVIK
ncbi:MAG: N-6 DNA methylase [Ignavibacteriae bacterium]|nr:N-6 DNA methylase [Ignavibacteriota bacterium]